MPFVYLSCYYKSFIVYFWNLIKEPQIKCRFAREVQFFPSSKTLHARHSVILLKRKKMVGNGQSLNVYFLFEYTFLSNLKNRQAHFKFMIKPKLVWRKLKEIFKDNSFRRCVFYTRASDKLMFHFQSKRTLLFMKVSESQDVFHKVDLHRKNKSNESPLKQNINRRSTN